MPAPVEIDSGSPSSLEEERFYRRIKNRAIASGSPYGSLDLDEHNLFPIEQAMRKTLLDECSAYMSSSDLKLVKTATAMALWAHQDQWRASGDPYSVHFFDIATGLALRHRQDGITIASALLHDVMEDQGINYKFIVKGLNHPVAQEVAETVNTLSNLRGRYVRKDLADAKYKAQLVESFIEDPRVGIIKIYDVLHNLSTLKHLRPEKQKSKIQEAHQLYVPLARRLALFDEANEIEQLCLRNLDQENNELVDKIQKWIDQKVAGLHLDEVRDEIAQLTGVTKEFISIRPPTVYDIFREKGTKKFPDDNDFYVNYDIVLPEYYDGEYSVNSLKDQRERRKLGDREFTVAKNIFFNVNYNLTDLIDVMHFISGLDADILNTLSFDLVQKQQDFRLRIHISPYDTWLLEQIPMTYRYFQRAPQQSDLALEGEIAFNPRNEVREAAMHYLAEKKVAYAIERIKVIKERLGESEFSAQAVRQLEARPLAGYIYVTGIDEGGTETPWMVMGGSTIMDYAKDIAPSKWQRVKQVIVNGQPVPYDYIIQPADRVHVDFYRKGKYNWDPRWIHSFRTDNAGPEEVRKAIYKVLSREKKEGSSAKWFQVLEVGKQLLSRQLNNMLRIGLSEARDIIQEKYPQMDEVDFFFALGMGEVETGIVEAVADRLQETNLNVMAFNIYFEKDQPGQASAVLDILAQRDINLAGARTSSIGDTGPTVVTVYLHPKYTGRMKALEKAIRNDPVCREKGLETVAACAPPLSGSIIEDKGE